MAETCSCYQNHYNEVVHWRLIFLAVYAYSKMREGLRNWSHPVEELRSKTRYWTMYIREAKTRKEAWAASTYPKGRNKMLERERGNTASHSLENSLWICLWACCKTDYEVMMMMMMMINFQTDSEAHPAGCCRHFLSRYRRRDVNLNTQLNLVPT